MNVMIDLETMGTGPRSAIVAIGAVEFDPAGDELGRQFYIPVDLASSVAAGMTMDPDTVLWWLKQGDAARAELTAADRMPLAHALQALSRFLAGEDGKTKRDQRILWANGTSFDLPILAEAYRLCALPDPWMYYNERDWRTLRKTLPPVDHERIGTHHDALDDACHQAQHLQRVMARLNSEVPPCD